MRLDDLSVELLLIANRGGGFGSDTENAIKELADILKLHPNISVSDLRKLLSPKPKKAPKAPVPLADDLVRHYVARFEAARNISEAEAILAEISTDKRVKLAEAVEVARGYTKAKKSFKSKAAAFDAVRDLFRREAWDSGAIDIINAQAVR